MALYNSPTLICNTCHGATGAGLLGPNISGSVSAGIGSWTEAQFAVAVRTGINKKGEMLCALMPMYPETDSDLADLYAYLLSQPNDTMTQGSYASAGCTQTPY
jgi:mono/diheme cytochrome c family protein